MRLSGLLIFIFILSFSTPVHAPSHPVNEEEGPSYVFITSVAGFVAVFEVTGILLVAKVKKLGLEMPLTVFIMSFFLTIAMTGFMLYFHEQILGAHEIIPIDFAAHFLRDGLIGFDIAVPVSLIAFPISEKITGLITGKSKRPS